MLLQRALTLSLRKHALWLFPWSERQARENWTQPRRCRGRRIQLQFYFLQHAPHIRSQASIKRANRAGQLRPILHQRGELCKRSDQYPPGASPAFLPSPPFHTHSRTPHSPTSHLALLHTHHILEVVVATVRSRVHVLPWSRAIHFHRLLSLIALLVHCTARSPTAQPQCSCGTSNTPRTHLSHTKHTGANTPLQLHTLHEGHYWSCSWPILVLSGDCAVSCIVCAEE